MARLPDMRRRPINQDLDREAIRAMRRNHYAARMNKPAAVAADTALVTEGHQSQALGGPADGAQTAGEAPADRKDITIPDNWEEMAWPQLRKLAAEITGHPIAKRDEAILAIRQEVERRKA